VTGRFASFTPGDPGSWRRLARNEKPMFGEHTRTRMIGVKPTYVWDVTQTSGDPVPEVPQPILLRGEAPAGLWDGLADRSHPPASSFASSRPQPRSAAPTASPTSCPVRCRSGWTWMKPLR